MKVSERSKRAETGTMTSVHEGVPPGPSQAQGDLHLPSASASVWEHSMTSW